MSAGPAEDHDQHKVDNANLSVQGMVRENQATDSDQDAPTITVEGPGQDDKLDLNDMKNVFLASAPTPKRLAQILEAILNRGQASTPYFKQWEDDWINTLNTIDSVSEFHLSSTLNDAELDALMFDDSFTLSRAYFAALQTLRSISNMVDDVLQNLDSLRQDWDGRAPVTRMFSSHDLSIAAKNWDTLTTTVERRAQRVHARIARKTEEIKSLRDGLFNATSLREASKGIALNRAIYVFTVVTVLYTPIGFLAASGHKQ
ncbi:hypothetical protein NEMBOFW57_010744 [Staphylotrichum longicolle]|uniref:Uncharacterized protein n=1 Tax=Staphylotrichum longicolle TaxID=669026 RepID=A0AAD4HV18_9PEZI|nr:hypothetical protein NEMBOFW57_010744 [Staphylotrichum longicolle]